MKKITAEELILAIIENNKGEWSSKTRLYKAFYLSHLYYWSDNPSCLTNCSIARMPNGPGIDNGTIILNKMENDGLIQISDTTDGPYPENTYLITQKGKDKVNLSKDAKIAINKAINYCSGKTAAELSEFTHFYSRSWNMSKDGDILNIYIDTISDEDFYENEKNITKIENIFNMVGAN